MGDVHLNLCRALEIDSLRSQLDDTFPTVDHFPRSQRGLDEQLTVANAAKVLSPPTPARFH